MSRLTEKLERRWIEEQPKEAEQVRFRAGIA
jgi:hypothetical protein